jgi:predicted branched-subunit amino acid permease
MRAGLPFALPTLVLGVSFGVVAQPVIGAAAAVAMSVLVFGGGAQFAALSVLAAGGGALPASVAGLLMNTRFLPMGLAAGPSLPGRALARALQGQALVDAAWAVANRGSGRFDRGILIGAALPQFVGWVVGTVLGVLGGASLAHPERFGLDAIFPAFYLAIVVAEVRSSRAVAAALLGAAITLALMPIAPPGVPVIAASLAALIGLRAR